MIIYNSTSGNVLCSCNFNLISTFFHVHLCRVVVYSVACDFWLFKRNKGGKLAKTLRFQKKERHKQIATVHAHSDYFLGVFFSTILSVLQIYLINKCIFWAHNTQMHATVNSFTECAVMALSKRAILL